MSYNPQEIDLEILRQPTGRIYSKAELLNKSFKAIEYLDGELIDDSYSIDADSDIRATYNITMMVKNSSFLVGSNKKIWFDKYIRLYIGFYHLRSREIIYYPVGIFIFESAGYSYDAITNELSLSCGDRMSELTGSRNGQIPGLSTTIAAGTSIREAIKNTIAQLGSIEKYRIEDVGETVPYDLDFNTGATVYEMVKALRDLYPGWETFFEDEYFICQPYPTCLSDPVVLDSDILSPLVISEQTDIDFTQVKNVIELWGKCLETDYYSGTVTYASNTYSATYGTVSSLTDGTMFGFLASNDNLVGSYFKVDGFTAYPIICEGNIPIASGRIKSGSAYVLKYVVSGSSSYFYFCGQYQICAVTKLVSAEPSAEKKAADLLAEPTRNISYVVEAGSPFCCDLEGMTEIRQVLSDGDYANIYSEDLATTRAEYELWKATDLLDTITLVVREIPWLGVNKKITYKSNITGETETYIVKKKSGTSTGGTMTITCQKFQPLYPWTN